MSLVACLAVALLAAAQDPQPQKIESLGITLTFPGEFEVEVNTSLGTNQVASWRGKLLEKRVEIVVIDPPDPDFTEPTEVTDRIRDNLRYDKRKPDPNFEWDTHELVEGKFGWAPYASLATRAIRAEGHTDVTTVFYYLGGLLEKKGYLVIVSVSPRPNKDEDALVRSFLTQGVSYAGKPRDPKWTDEEAHQRWKDGVPGSDKKPRLLETIIRTDHYVILTNSSGGKLFAKKMEECYATIKKVYPFEDSPGQRLMPVFLFQMADEFYDFLVKHGMTMENARKAKGVAYDDLYTTWYEAPADPTHIHEATHQIFRNRLFLGGGGSWFQEGVAEYIETTKNERNDIARIVKDGQHTPLREFVTIKSLLFSPKKDEEDKSGRSEAQDHYKQAALIIEFLRESKFGKDKFQEWLHAIGNVARNDLGAIEAATRAIYGVDLDGLDKELVAYCKKR